MTAYCLVSHPLCPYVQRIAIALAERGIDFERITIDLAHKPEWFLKLSPLGKVPLLQVGETILFESSVILEFLEDTLAKKMHPADPLTRARHRGWMEFGSATLNAIAGLYTAPDAKTYDLKRADIRSKLLRLEEAMDESPWFAGRDFSLVDAVWAPVFRYFDVFAAEGLDDPAKGLPKITAWRKHLMTRPSVRHAVPADYPRRLADFLIARNSHMSRLIRHREAA